MDKLNEYCLHHINTFLEPRDWLQVSQGKLMFCQFCLQLTQFLKTLNSLYFLNDHQKMNPISF